MARDTSGSGVIRRGQADWMTQRQDPRLTGQGEGKQRTECQLGSRTDGRMEGQESGGRCLHLSMLCITGASSFPPSPRGSSLTPPHRSEVSPPHLPPPAPALLSLGEREPHSFKPERGLKHATPRMPLWHVGYFELGRHQKNSKDREGLSLNLP